jgi:hypothetical protein
MKTTEEPKRFTRADYMEKRCTHREYYAQFVTEGIRQQVLSAIGKETLLRSTDPHLNDIPLAKWDSIHQRFDAIATRFSADGDNSMNAGTCIVKEAARQIIESERPPA